LIRSKFKIF